MAREGRSIAYRKVLHIRKHPCDGLGLAPFFRRDRDVPVPSVQSIRSS